MRKRSVSVTGATGFLGSHIAAELVARGWNVRAIVRRAGTKPVADGAEIQVAPLERSALAAAMPFLLLLMAIAKLPIANPTPFFIRSERIFR